jgi:hypothetical protein
VVGALPHAAVGQTLRFAGAWGAHEKFGVQLRAARCEEIAPQSREALAAYLAGSALPGARMLAPLHGSLLRTPYETTSMPRPLQLQTPANGAVSFVRTEHFTAEGWHTAAQGRPAPPYGATPGQAARSL